MGFDAIWISPVPDNYPNDFHGYAARDMTKINSYFGGESGLHALVNACHSKGSIFFPRILTFRRLGDARRRG